MKIYRLHNYCIAKKKTFLMGWIMSNQRTDGSDFTEGSTCCRHQMTVHQPCIWQVRSFHCVYCWIYRRLLVENNLAKCPFNKQWHKSHLEMFCRRVLEDIESQMLLDSSNSILYLIFSVFFVGFSTGWCVTGGVAERDDTILRTITAAGSRTTSCRTSASWDCSTSTWRWVSY